MTATTTIPPPQPIKADILTLPEIADLAGVEKKTAEQWKFRAMERAKPPAPGEPTKRKSRVPPFPEPDDHVGFWPVWRLPRVIAWLELTHKPYDVDRWRTKREAGGYRRLGGKADRESDWVENTQAGRNPEDNG